MNVEGLYKDFSDLEDSEQYEQNGSDSDDESWHSDASKKDDSDDDLVFEKKIWIKWFWRLWHPWKI